MKSTTLEVVSILVVVLGPIFGFAFAIAFDKPSFIILFALVSILLFFAFRFFSSVLKKLDTIATMLDRIDDKIN